MFRLLSSLFLALLLAGCASLPPRLPQASSHALTDVAGSRIAQVAAASLPADPPAASGFRFLPEGESAFNARLALARAASHSLDVQYYLLQADETGLAFVRELRAAARRGVRVRLIVDDLYAAREDTLLAALAAEPGFEVRIFNPLPARAGSFALRLLLSLHEFGRINHRMHNKLFVADNSCAVSGGRNIANEYFMRNPQANFIDLDVLSCGAVVRELSAVFDSYWNSEQVFDIGQLVALPARDEAARWLDEQLARAPAELEERELDVLGGEPVARQLQAGRLALVPGRAQVFADSPAKVAGLAGAAAQRTVTEQTLALFAQAREEVHIASPYFIPGERGLAMIRAVGATQDNGRISLVTNSLGATDEPLVHAGYARYRREMLKAGVRIYELSPTLAQRSGRLGNFGRSLSRLHAKAATIDRRIVFIGSMNMDPRSAYLNTELGLAIDSPELAAVMGRLFREDLAIGAYRLRLAADGEQIEWVETAPDGSTTVHADEPDDRWWWRLERWLLSPLVGDRML